MLTIDLANHQVWHREEMIALTKTQFEILRLLVAHPGQVVLRDQFNSCIWEHRGVFVDQNTLNVHISNLKKRSVRTAATSRPCTTSAIAGCGR
ncbi:MAG: winged helix-turn-helix domain-containing protein [Merdibacter sp.]